MVILCVDAEKLSDLLRVDLLPEWVMMSEELRELRSPVNSVDASIEISIDDKTRMISRS